MGGDFLQKRYFYRAALAGLLAGIVNGIFGGAGGMVLIPALRLLSSVQEDELFPISVAVMLPVCVLSLFLSSRAAPLPWADAMPYLLGSALGGKQLLLALGGGGFPGAVGLGLAAGHLLDRVDYHNSFTTFSLLMLHAYSM